MLYIQCIFKAKITPPFAYMHKTKAENAVKQRYFRGAPNDTLFKKLQKH